MISFEKQRVRDPLHDLIEFDSEEFEHTLWRVVQTKPFQRLRRVKQLGFSDFVYPSANHTRFAHSLGVFHTARLLMKVIEKHLGETIFKPTRSDLALAAALVHDLGHGPFSHAFEDVGKRLGIAAANHELITERLIRDSEITEAMSPKGSGFANDVADVIKNAPADIYGAVVSSQFDADRLDYMQRDRLMTGAQIGGIDFKWLLANLEVGEVPLGVDDTEAGRIETFVLGKKANFAAESYVLGLFHLYPTVYFHKATRSAEKMFCELLFRTIDLILNGYRTKTGLPNNHPLVRYANDPENTDNFLALDDAVITGSLPLLSGASDKSISSFASRLSNRKLFKAIDARVLLTKQHPKEEHNEFVDRACAAIVERVEDWVLSKKTNRTRILIDEAIRNPYKRFDESKGPLNQILMKSSDDKLVDIAEQSSVVAAILPFKLNRLYVADEDTEAHEFVTKLIQEEGSKNG